MNKILITGGAGYIGSVLTRVLLEQDYKVRVIDNLRFGGDSLLGVYNNKNFDFIKGDIRNKEDIKQAIDGVDSVVHLAAIVGDPACAEEPDIAKETNWQASKNLYDLCVENGNIDRFVFASTCSNYGKMEGQEYVDEDSKLRPVSLYAELKVKFEKYLLESDTNDDLSSTSLRFATAYGLSPRPRFDLTVNDFTRHLHDEKELVIYGEQFWRPYCHVNDIANSIKMVLNNSKELVDNQVFGVGSTEENYRKRMVVEELLKFFPDAKLKYVKKEKDPRDYKVNFSKISDKLGFTPEYSVEDGIEEIKYVLENNLISNPHNENYTNT